ncbi:MAG: hypothetical protein B9S33_21695 [Pedosphaera sp. Tous-C6FEB]|nr:MAG: hypothetical protein B9S33_21695 [Pedosphaera sp. Tous-C6FEB]
MTVRHKVAAVLGLLLVPLGASWSMTPILDLAGLPLLFLGLFTAIFACAGQVAVGASGRPFLMAALAAVGVLCVTFSAVLGAAAGASHYMNLNRHLPSLLAGEALGALLLGGTGATIIVWALASIRKCLLKELWRIWLYWFAYPLLALAMTWLRGANGAPFSP